MRARQTILDSGRRTAFFRTVVTALLSGLLSTLLWTAATELMSGPSAVLAQSGDPQQATATRDVRYVQIAVEVFLDVVGVGRYDCPGCNGLFDAGDWAAQPGGAPTVELIVRDGATGLEMVRQTTATSPGSPIGRAFFSVPERELLVLELAQIPEGSVLCPNSSRSRVIRPADFGYGVIGQTFTFWQGCPAVSLAVATATPVPVETVAPPPTDTPVPTDTPAPSATPLPPTLTPTLIPSPTEEPRPTAVSVALQPATPTPASPPPTPTQAPPPAEPPREAAPTPTLEPTSSPPTNIEPTLPPTGPKPVPTEISAPVIAPVAPDEGAEAGTGPILSPDRGASGRAIYLPGDQQELQRAIAKALSETRKGTEALDVEALTHVLARAVEIRVEEEAEELHLTYEQSIRRERRQGMVMAFFTGVAGVFTASFWKALLKTIVALASQGFATASPGWATTLLLALAPMTGLKRRQCSNCRHYQPSNMRGQGWCRNSRLYAPHVRHLVQASDLDCARTHLPDLWESHETVETRVQ